MDVTPPSPAPAPSRPSTLRRLGIALAGVAVAALTGAACALSFDDLRALALAGEARSDLAYLYPAAFDALLVVALVGVLLLRAARPLVRAQAAVVLVLLLGAAAAADVATALRVSFDATRAAVGVALAPWVMLAVALWVWLLLIKHVQTARAADAADGAAGAGGEDDIVPFRRTGAPEEAPPLTAYPAEQVLRPTPVVGPTPAPETPPVSEPRPVSETRPPAETTPVSERVTEWPAATARAAAREPESRRKQDSEPGPLPAPPAEEPAPSPERRPRSAVRETAEPEPKEAERRPEPTPAAEPEPEAEPEVAPEPEAVPEAAPEPREERRRVRWGDRVKPSDVLVHPLKDRGPDTQPVPVVPVDEEDPREPRRHRAEDRADDGDGDGGETAEGGPEEDLEDTAPHPAVTDDTPPPAKRVRSTPRPPED
ncbi:hypothetical protein [Nonomuraea pusilla]|uniref:DUF2637 domain-containing protein n=1 Tax=Nonomuraea pusilla TaxID=46177 RepID=A0A1H8GA45_9ACTN|nr:hypothetical protein [Nonomuraea pusilla]SEN41011.1 hypothetical protein SAMN05660976_07491 [Nonomuraea pusilla]